MSDLTDWGRVYISTSGRRDSSDYRIRAVFDDYDKVTAFVNANPECRIETWRINDESDGLISPRRSPAVPGGTNP